MQTCRYCKHSLAFKDSVFALRLMLSLLGYDRAGPWLELGQRIRAGEPIMDYHIQCYAPLAQYIMVPGFQHVPLKNAALRKAKDNESKRIHTERLITSAYHALHKYLGAYE